MTTIENLTEGQVLIVSVKKVAGEKFQLELAEKIKNPTSRMNVLALVNAGDDRFKQSSGARRAWLTGTAEGFKSTFGIDCTGVTETPKEINKLAPQINGMDLHIEIVETITPSDYQKANVQSTAKQNGKGKFFMFNNQYIFSNTAVVAGEAKHKLLKITDDQGAYLANCGLVDFGTKVSSTPSLDIVNLG